MATNARLSATAALALACAGLGCAVLPLYFPAFASRSPDSRTEVRVTRNFPGSDAEYRFRVEVTTTRGTSVIYREDRGSAIGLVEAHWSPNGDQVGVLVCNIFTKPLLVGYDVAHSQALDGSVFRSAIEDQLGKKYSLAKGTDAVDWACSPAGSAAYSSRKR